MSGTPVPSDNRPRLVDSLTLAALPTAVGCARILVQHCLRQWGLHPLLDDATLVTSELVTNAVKATGTIEDTPRWTDKADTALIALRLVVTGKSLYIEVWDRDPLSPAIRQPPGPDADNGRGLLIVEALCVRWNCFYPRGGGKVVWGELALPPRGATSLGSLSKPSPAESRRMPKSRHSPELLHRVRNRLNEL